MKRHLKKGIELSLNFLVTIIIALVILGFGIRFAYNLGSEATQMSDLTTEQLDKKIAELLCDSSEMVCIGVDKKTIQKGKYDVFGIKIVNIQDGRNFMLSVTPVGYTKNNEPITDVGLDKIQLKHNENFFIERNGQKEIGLGVEVAKNANSGTYILDVVMKTESNGVLVQYAGLHKIYVEVP